MPVVCVYKTVRLALVFILATAASADVETAQARGVAYLKSLQQRNGSFWVKGGYRGWPGSTARVLDALTVSGVTASDKTVQRGLRALRYAKPTHTMRVHLIHALARIGAGKHRARIHELAAGLLEDPVPWADAPARRSATGLTALAVARKCGFRVPDRAWQHVKSQLVHGQGPHGRWIHRSRRPKPHPNTPVSPNTSAHTAFYLTTYLLVASELDSRAAAWRSEPARKALRFLLAHPIDDRFTFKDLWFDPVYEDAHKAQVRYLLGAQRPDGSWLADERLPWGPLTSTTQALQCLARKPELDMPTARRFAQRPDAFPHMQEPNGLRRAFDLYVTYQPGRRAEVADRFGPVPGIVRFLANKLADDNVAIRAAAHDLLSRLLGRKPREPFDAEGLRWDPRLKKLVRTSGIR